MRGERCGKQILRIFVAAILLCLSSSFVQAQEGRRAAASSPPTPESETAAEVRVLSSMIHDLQAQVQSLNSQLGDLRVEEQQTSEEARALRHELDLAKAKMTPSLVESAGQYSTPGSVPLNAPPGSASTLAAPQGATEAERISKLEENLDVVDAKVNDQYQTKVESGSKYRVRLSGIVLLNLYDNAGLVDNQDFPEVAQPPHDNPLFVSPSSFGATMRQSQIKLQAFGPDLAGARTSADVEFDFAGGFPAVWNGAAIGIVRMRTATMRLDWTNTSVIVGQDHLFFAPLAPTSLATVATPALSYAGNLWAWTPQVRVEHRFHFSDVSTVTLQAGILDSLTGDLPEPGNDRLPSWEKNRVAPRMQPEFPGVIAHLARISR